MKTHKNLYAQICTFENLLLAAHQAAAGKRFRPEDAQLPKALCKQKRLLAGDSTIADELAGASATGQHLGVALRAAATIGDVSLKRRDQIFMVRPSGHKCQAKGIFASSAGA